MSIHTSMIYISPVQTPRLLLRHESLNDFQRFFEMSKDPCVMKHIGDGSIFHWTKEQALEKFTDRLKRQQSEEFVNLAVYTRDGNRYIGWCGIGYSKFLDHLELGYRYCIDSWHNGFATEAAAAILAETFRLTDIDRIMACAHPENKASIRVLEKIGFSHTGSKHSRPAKTDISIYRIDRTAFAKSIQKEIMP